MNSPAASCWLTASEIAMRCLPGLPADKRAVNALASAQGWSDSVAEDGTPLARRRAARGGGMEYHASLLPEPAQEVLSRIAEANRLAPTAANDAGNADAEAWAWYDQQPTTTKTKALQRLTILREVEARMESGAAKTAATEAVARKHGVSPRAVADWFALVANATRSNWLPRLASQYKGGGKKVEIDAEAWQLLKSDYLRPEKPAFAACYNRVVEEYAKPRGITLPNPKTLKRRLESEIGSMLLAKRRDGREALRKMIPPQRRSVADLHAMEAVNIDGHTFDVFVQWEDGTIGRPIMVGIQDLFSRKLLAHRIGQSESTSLARLTFADLFREWGIPGHAVLDNGRAFASKALTGGAKTRFRFTIKEYEATGVLTALNVTAHWTLPYRGSSKPIERAWRDLCEYVAKHPAVSGAYTGNKPDAKPENYRERAIPIDEFRAHVARCIAAHNARAGRRTETANGGSFDEAFAASYAANVIGRANEVQLRIALLEAQERRCHRDHGSVTIMGNRYWTPELAELRGQKVVVRFDPENLHSDAYIYRADGSYLFAAPVQETDGFFSQDAAKRHAKDVAKLKKLGKAYQDQADLLDAARVAELYSGHSEAAPKPAPGATRIVRHRGHTAAALKPTQQVEHTPADPAFIDAFVAGNDRLRIVE